MSIACEWSKAVCWNLLIEILPIRSPQLNQSLPSEAEFVNGVTYLIEFPAVPPAPSSGPLP